MGYYSDACLCLSEKAVKKFKAGLTLEDASKLKNVGKFLEDSEHHKLFNSGDEIWFWRGVKWYTEFEEIAFMDALMGELEEKEYLFIRVGENIDDSEIQGCYTNNGFDMNLRRTIEFEKPL